LFIKRPVVFRIGVGLAELPQSTGRARIQHAAAILRLGNNYTNTAGPRRIIPVPFRLSAVKSIFDGF